MDSRKPVERFLQRRRFDAAAPYVLPPVLDIGGNHGELGSYLGLKDGDYRVWNGKGNMPDRAWGTIVLLAVIEHLPVEVLARLDRVRARRIIATSPAPLIDPLLRFMGWVGLLDRANIREHRQYFTFSGFKGAINRRVLTARRFDVVNRLVVWDER